MHWRVVGVGASVANDSILSDQLLLKLTSYLEMHLQPQKTMTNKYKYYSIDMTEWGQRSMKLPTWDNKRKE